MEGTGGERGRGGGGGEGGEEEEGVAFNLNGLTQVITRAGNLGAETKSWK